MDEPTRLIAEWVESDFSQLFGARVAPVPEAMHFGHETRFRFWAPVTARPLGSRGPRTDPYAEPERWLVRSLCSVRSRSSVQVSHLRLSGGRRSRCSRNARRRSTL
jgi:hypothetical protein